MQTRKLPHLFVSSILVTVLMLAIAVPAVAYFVPSTYQPATLVLGQPNFTSSSAVTTQTGMFSPANVAIDPTTQKVFVADTQNNRVLRFASVYALANGAPAEVVLGQPAFNTNAPATTQSGLQDPEGVSVDAAGRLWVADTFNHRVLRFDNASAIGSGANANAVLGQSDFISGSQGIAQNRMHSPVSLFADAGGRLWVVDTSNSRILRFDNAVGKGNGANADGVLGQPDFTSNSSSTTQSSMAYPYGAAVDAAGRLWVADMVNNRVLRFNNAASLGNGANASGVLGQPDFTTDVNHTTQNGMFEPFGVAADPSGNVYVADTFNSRILVYPAAAGLSNGANATYVLGQPDFTSNTPNNPSISAATLNDPFGAFYDPVTKGLWVADQYNHRVLMYGQPSVYMASNSAAASDGWMLESAQNSHKGGTASTAGTLRLGDDAANKQYRSLLSFDTSSLPDNAVVRGAMLMIKKAGGVGADPLKSFGFLLADIKDGTFGAPALKPTDFQAPASASAFGHFVSAGGGWYQLVLPPANFSFINLTGTTQFRLRFAKVSNNNHLANYDLFFAGNAIAANQPVLVVEYTLP
jgi:sugar lactone lactonase YvrE